MSNDSTTDLAALMPMIDRAEKNAAIVLGQQKTLTQVGDALRRGVLHSASRPGGRVSLPARRTGKSAPSRSCTNAAAKITSTSQIKTS